MDFAFFAGGVHCQGCRASWQRGGASGPVWECAWDAGGKLRPVKQRLDKRRGNAPQTVADVKQAHDDAIQLAEVVAALAPTM